MVARYDGPLIDAHHHLWDLSLGRHKWLTGGDETAKALGDISYMRRDYLPDDYRRDAAGQDIAATVYIEALWDRTRPPEEEVRWVESLGAPHGIASRCVAWADLRAADADDVLAGLAAHPCVVGVRENIRWHPDPARSWAAAAIAGEPPWRRGLARLSAHGLHLELLMNTHQMDEVAELARDFPDQTFVVNHCGTPADRDAAGMAAWRSGLRAMAARPNVAIKASAFEIYAADHSIPALRSVVMAVIDAFGPARTMFGTDYPVARRHMPFGEMCDAFRDCVAELSVDEQRAVLHDTAGRYYRLP